MLQRAVFTDGFRRLLRGRPLRALAATAALLPGLTRAGEPFCDWLSGVADAAQAQSVGDFRAAEEASLRALSSRPRGDAAARARAALGLSLAGQGRTDAATLQALDGALPALSGIPRAQVALLRGEALLAAGRAAEAAEALRAIADQGGTVVAHRAAWREPDALLAASRPADAAARLEALLGDDPGDPAEPAARLALAGARRLVGDDLGAIATYRALWLDVPWLPEASRAGEALARWRAAGGPVPAPSGEDRATRADRLLADARPGDALAELELIGTAAPPAPPASRVGALRALALFASGRRAEAEAAARPLLGAASAGDRRAAEWVCARVAARAGHRDEAAVLYARVAAETAPVPGFPEWRARDLADESGYLAAWLAYDAGDFHRAARQLDAFVKAHPRSRRADDARWFAAWARARVGHRSQAAAAFARLGRGAHAAGARYWEARFSPPERRPRLYREAIAADPQGWYALLARARLRALGLAAPRIPVPDVRPLPACSGPAADRLAGAAALLALGLRDAALAELDDLARSRAVRPVASLAAQLAAFVGDAELPFRLARDHLLPTRRALRWAHPAPYRPDALARARALGLDPSLLLAVMRRESGFNAGSRSFAAAEGLLQLVGTTADRLAAVLGLDGGTPARLADPEVNVTLGAWYLSLLASRFGDPALAVAAYNAGPGSATGWVVAEAGTPLDLFVEQIPFRETRQYVKVVLADWAVYRDLAGEPPPPIDPEHRIAAPAIGIAF